MKKQKLLLITVLLIFSFRSFSQNFVITTPKLEFDGKQLSISYDLVSKEKSDIFYVWVEMKTQSGVPIWAYTYKGEVGDSIKPGNNKKIVWVPDEDAIYIDDDITIELKGERYVKSFNKGSALLLSTVVPGLGQTKIHNGKPWWLLSIPAYGALAGGLVVHKNYIDTYNDYLASTDAVERGDLLDKSQKLNNLSSTMLIAGAAIWVLNIVWVAATPDKYKPMLHPKLSFNSVPFNNDRVTMVSLRIDF
jgi:hypothetical protein